MKAIIEMTEAEIKEEMESILYSLECKNVDGGQVAYLQDRYNALDYELFCRFMDSNYEEMRTIEKILDFQKEAKTEEDFETILSALDNL